MFGRAGLLLKAPGGMLQTITQGPAVEVDPATQFYSYYTSCERAHLLDTTRGLIVWAAFNPSNSTHTVRAVPFTYSGGTLTVLTSNLLNMDPVVGGIVHSAKLSGDEVIVMYQYVGLRACVLTLNPDNTISRGASTVLDGNTGLSVQVAAFSATKAVAAYRPDNTGIFTARAMTIAAKAVTTHPLAFGTSNSNGISLVALDSTYALASMGNGELRSIRLNGDDTVTLSGATSLSGVSGWTKLSRLAATRAAMMLTKSANTELQTVSCTGGVISLDGNAHTLTSESNVAGMCALTDEALIALSISGSTYRARRVDPAVPMVVGTPNTVAGNGSVVDRLDDTHAIMLYTPAGGRANVRVLTLS
jgi:hypothetical protein